MESSKTPISGDIGSTSVGRQGKPIIAQASGSTSIGITKPTTTSAGTRFNNIVSFANEDQIIPNGGRSNPDLFKTTVNQRGTPAPSLHPNPLKSSFRAKDNSKGFKKFLSMIKKTESPAANLEPNHFVRGGIRSTAGPRLISGERRRLEIDIPFPRFDNALLAQWFNSIGLGMYSEQCKQIFRTGEQLFNATENEIEKYLGMKNKLHRKKLKLALAFANNDCDPLTQAAHRLDYLWVARWLDDIGLPQFKENFLNARVDGAVLHRLTMQDLINLNITAKLHYCSIRRGIQVLREQKFDPNCLERRAVSDKLANDSKNPATIALWTSHRVMEWLRCVDLSEYTSSLRGSGVHGALMVHEPAFDADLLASLLGIPSSKSLLRRHIYTSFNDLLGPELVQIKRDYLVKNPSSIASSKITIKSSRFNLLKRRSKPEFQSDDLVCPLSNSLETKMPCPVHQKPNSESDSPAKHNNVSNGETSA